MTRNELDALMWQVFDLAWEGGKKSALRKLAIPKAYQDATGVNAISIDLHGDSVPEIDPLDFGTGMIEEVNEARELEHQDAVVDNGTKNDFVRARREAKKLVARAMHKEMLNRINSDLRKTKTC